MRKLYVLVLAALMIIGCTTDDPDVTSFSYPKMKEATQGDMYGNIMIVWDLVEGADAYRIYRKHPDLPDQWDEISEISYHLDFDNGYNLTDRKIVPGATYQYRLSSVSDEHGESEISPVFEAFSAYPPDKPVISSITVGQDCIQLTWLDDNPKLKNEYWPRDYNVYIAEMSKPDEFEMIGTTEEKEFCIDQLTAGKNYLVKIRIDAMYEIADKLPDTNATLLSATFARVYSEVDTIFQQ